VKELYRGSRVRVFRLDREGVLERLRHAAARLLAERPEVVRVWLFGSLARGDASPGSDADLIIVVRDGAEAFLERAAPLMPFFDDVGVGCDVLVYTETELDQLARTPSLVRTALANAVLLGGQPTNPI
jgi:predicted nucleotidyltransferase